MSRTIACADCAGSAVCRHCGAGPCTTCAGRGTRLTQSDTLPTGAPAVLPPARAEAQTRDDSPAPPSAAGFTAMPEPLP